MRGPNQEQDHIFSYRSPAERVPSDHPLRIVKDMANRALKALSMSSARCTPPWAEPRFLRKN